MNRRVVLSAVTLGAVLVAVPGFAKTGHPGHAASPFGPAPTDAAARAFLDRQFQAAQRHDAPAYCAAAFYPHGCLGNWHDRGGDAAAPTVRPTVAGSRVVEQFRVLHVCGVDGAGRGYRTDFVVETYLGHVRELLPVFWSDMPFTGMSESDTGPTEPC